MKSHWIWRYTSFSKSLQLAILSAYLRVIWPRSTGNVSSQHFFKPCVQLMFYWRALLQLYVKTWNGQCHKMKLQFWYFCIIYRGRNNSSLSVAFNQTQISWTYCPVFQWHPSSCTCQKFLWGWQNALKLVWCYELWMFWCLLWSCNDGIPLHISNIFSACRDHIRITCAWHNSARCTRHQKSLASLLLLQRNSCWCLKHCHNVGDLSVLFLLQDWEQMLHQE